MNRSNVSLRSIVVASVFALACVAGVMRADWPDALLNLEREEWHFSVIEAARMHRALAAIPRGSLANAATLRSTSDRFDPFSH